MEKDAFTLLELIIVLALLAILASVAVVKFVDLSSKAIDIQEEMVGTSIRTAVLLYRANYDVWPDGSGFEDGTWNPFSGLDNPPPNCRYDGGICNSGNGTRWAWARVQNAGSIYWRSFCPHQNHACTGRGAAWTYFVTSGTTNWNVRGNAGQVMKECPTWNPACCTKH